jgi:hypothetical protein
MLIDGPVSNLLALFPECDRHEASIAARAATSRPVETKAWRHRDEEGLVPLDLQLGVDDDSARWRAHR